MFLVKSVAWLMDPLYIKNTCVISLLEYVGGLLCFLTNEPASIMDGSLVTGKTTVTKKSQWLWLLLGSQVQLCNSLCEETLIVISFQKCS